MNGGMLRKTIGKRVFFLFLMTLVVSGIASAEEAAAVDPMTAAVETSTPASATRVWSTTTH